MSATKPLQLRFAGSAASDADLPGFGAEVAVAGRSNVGKSSLINALANQRDLARTSKSPGRTQMLNAFELCEGPEPHPGVIDLPGYGYAAVPDHLRREWGPMIESYLLGSEVLEMVLVLIDGEVGPTRLDLGMLEWVRHNQLPHSVVATKHDKVKASKRDRRRRDLAAGCDLEPRDVLWVSAHKGVNVDLLRSRIRGWLLPA